MRNDISFQLIPPHPHNNNYVEIISTYKSHLVAGLSSLGPNFPLHIWCRLIPYSLINLNLLQRSHVNLKFSAEAGLNGAFDYNLPPLAPPGIQMVVYETPNMRKPWDTHGVDG